MNAEAAQLLAQYRDDIGRRGEYIAIGRYVGTSRDRTDTVTRAYVRYYGSNELIGTIVQGDQTAIALVDTLSGILPVTVKDKLIVGFEVIDGVVTMDGAMTRGGREFAIKNPMKRVVGGTLIALEIHATG
jgi:hypothetical protein